MMFPDGATHGLCNQFNIPSTYWLISSHTCILVSIQVHFKKKKKKISLLLIWMFMWATSFALLRNLHSKAGFSSRDRIFSPQIFSASLAIKVSHSCGTQRPILQSHPKKKKKCIKKSLSRTMTTTTHPRRCYSVSRREARDECPNNLLR